MSSLRWAGAGLLLVQAHLLLSPLQSRDRHLLDGLVLQILRVQQQLLLRLQHLNGSIKGRLSSHFVIASMGFAVLELVGWASKPIWALRITEVHLRFALSTLALLE